MRRPVPSGCRLLLHRAQRSLAATMLLLAIGPAAYGASEINNEYAVKAAFLFHFAQLTIWPAQAFAHPDSPVVFCTIGKDPFDGSLDNAVVGKKIQGHPVKVLHLKQVGGLQGCHLLFTGEQEMSRMPALSTALRGLPVLTVGESEGFLKQGGMIDFRSEKERLRFDVNLSAAQSSNLGFSSTLLSLARSVAQGR
ncbi:MAG: YfiR family protein [Acidobacteria bacterium]|nr:YfiR family protein [Acidobacteriota bacterium]